MPPLDPPMSKNIIAGFRKTGIYPHDPQVIPAESLAVADLGGAPGARPPTAQNFLDFMQFFGKSDKIVCWRPPPPRVGAPSYRESWIRP